MEKKIYKKRTYKNCGRISNGATLYIFGRTVGKERAEQKKNIP